MLVPDETFVGEMSVGIYKSNNKNLLNLKEDQTLLSSIVVVKSDSLHSFAKPIIISVDHSAQFGKSDWNTSIFYKSPNSNTFEV